MLANFFKVALIVKNLPTNAGNEREAGLILWAKNILWKRKMEEK